ncbi:hypothetical protein XSR1_170048 [Xenorhabdus szentirmaii DSM 16338]|uniref:Uncharacterized protein n=1 Tax=Xenorhabdus szentirmaii DSM 16338 TaxID=1427518 RepID=W1IXL2_9GAMM|nr:hypothetical protein XSR1_170048 [Xenorhabdus szentirmaii DSM 16338]
MILAFLSPSRYVWCKEHSFGNVHERDLANYIDEQRELSAKERRKDTVSKEISERTRQKLSGCYHFSTPYIM